MSYLLVCFLGLGGWEVNRLGHETENSFFLYIYLFEVVVSLFRLSVAGLSPRWSRLNSRPNSVGFVVVGKVGLWQLSFRTRRASPVSFYLFTTDDTKHY